MANLSHLQERRRTLAKQIKDHAAKQKTWKAEDHQVWDRLNSDYDANQKAINDELAIQNRMKELGIANDGELNPHGRPSTVGVADQSLALQGWLLAGNEELRNQITDDHRNAAKRIGLNLSGNAFKVQLKNSAEVRDFQASHPFAGGYREGGLRNAQTSGNPTKGGYTTTTTLISSLEQAMLDFSGVRQVAEIMRTSTGEPIEFITSDDTANSGSRVGESQDADSATDATFGRVRLTSFTFTSGLLYVSRTLMRDSVLNLEQTLGAMLGERIGRKQNTDYTTGGGGGLSPQGIVTASVLGVTAASATALVWDEIIDLEHSIDPSRRNLPGVGYMLHDTILKYIRKLKDGNGQPIWQEGWNAGAPDTINKRPFWINQAMDSSISSGKKTMLFGQFSMFKVREIGSVTIQRLVERRAEYDQDAFIAYAYGDSALLNPGDDPVKHLVH